MPQLPRLIEKPGGARDVRAWDVHAEREYPGGPLRVYTEAACVRVVISVEFYRDSSAREFEARVRDMMPEAEV